MNIVHIILSVTMLFGRDWDIALRERAAWHELVDKMPSNMTCCANCGLSEFAFYSSSMSICTQQRNRNVLAGGHKMKRKDATLYAPTYYLKCKSLTAKKMCVAQSSDKDKDKVLKF